MNNSFTERVIVNGQTAVLYSPGYGAGWSTWSDDDQKEAMLFHPELVKWVQEGKQGGEKEAEKILKKIFGDENVPYLGGVDGLRIQWISVGTPFEVEQYDGSESIVTMYSMPFVA